MARLMTREAAAARESARCTRRLTQRPFSASVATMPAVKTRPRSVAKSHPARCDPVIEKSTAWLMVSNEIANAAPTAAMSTGCPACVNRAKRRLRRPAGRTTSPCGVRNTAHRFALPSSTRNAMEIHAPAFSSHSGARQSSAIVATAMATSVTTSPCPAEKRRPDQRDSRGRAPAL